MSDRLDGSHSRMRADRHAMSLSRRLAPYVSALITSPGLRRARRRLYEVRRRARGAPHRIEYFHQVDDPYSYLAAQTLAALLQRYDVSLVPHLVGPPADEAAPEPMLLAEFARRDCADIAPEYGLDFPDNPVRPDARAVASAVATLAAAPPDEFPQRAVEVGSGLWRGSMATPPQPGATANVRTLLEAGNRRRHRLGHYSSGMFHYGGEWYWGVDRLHHLENRLRSLGAARDPQAAAIVRPPSEGLAPGSPIGLPAATVSLEFFLSLRSPYTYIAMPRVFALAQRHRIELILRPVLPMVMRGLAVPSAKRLYIVRDTQREAERFGIPFGRICDPVGKPVERGFSFYRWAQTQGRAAEYLLSFARAAFAEGVDTGSPAGLRHVIVAAGLDWQEEESHREDSAWREELEANRIILGGLGLWGVPSFRIRGGGRPDYTTWGQDRLWRVEQEIRDRVVSAQAAFTDTST